MNPEFFIAPFDVVHPGHPAPSADFVGVWKEEPYLCRVCNGILHFRRATDEANVPIFAAVPPLAPELEDTSELWPLVWEEALDNERVARFINFPFRGAFDRDFPFYLGFDGRGWVRELWNRDDCHFSGGFSPTLAQFGNDGDLMDGVREIFHEVVIPWLEEMPVPQPLDDTEVEWLCGSLDELSRVARAVCALEPVLANRDTKLWFFAETPFERALLWRMANVFNRHWENGSYGPPEFRFPHMKLSPRFWTLIELALDFNTPSGLYWEYHDTGMGRTAYSPHCGSIQIQVPAPSKHEQTEAYLFLREWLRGKLPASQIEEVLNDV